jgi:hypothetical protein
MGRSRKDVQVSVTVFTAGGPEERAFARQQIAFYASTPSYRGVMALHGWEETAEALSGLASRGRWAEMPALVDDEKLSTFAVLAPAEELHAALEERYAGLVDRLALYVPFIPGVRDDFWSGFLRDH